MFESRCFVERCHPGSRTSESCSDVTTVTTQWKKGRKKQHGGDNAKARSVKRSILLLFRTGSSFANSKKNQTTPGCTISLKAITIGERQQDGQPTAAPVTANRSGPSTAAKLQPSIMETGSNCSPYEKKGARSKVITDMVAIYIAWDMVPIYARGSSQACLPCKNI